MQLLPSCLLALPCIASAQAALTVFQPRCLFQFVPHSRFSYQIQVHPWSEYRTSGCRGDGIWSEHTPLTDDSSSHLLIMQCVSSMYTIISQLTSNIWEVFKYALTSCSRYEHTLMSLTPVWLCLSHSSIFLHVPVSTAELLSPSVHSSSDVFTSVQMSQIDKPLLLFSWWFISYTFLLKLF